MWQFFQAVIDIGNESETDSLSDAGSGTDIATEKSNLPALDTLKRELSHNNEGPDGINFDYEIDKGDSGKVAHVLLCIDLDALTPFSLNSRMNLY